MQENIKQRIEAVINNIDQLPSIPEIASKVINMVNNPDISFKQIADEISKDQSMTTNILKLSNSAYFSKGKEVSSIDRAMVILGLKEVKNIIMVVATKPVLDKVVIGYDLDKGALWKQGLLVASLSNKIALMIKRKDLADVVFTGGILHNVGKVVIALYVKSVFNDILNVVQTQNIPFNQAERSIMGYDHQEVGDKILAKWKFPPVLRSIVRYYQEPDAAPDEHKLEVSIVHIANFISLMAGIGIGSDGLFHEVNKTAIEKVGLSDADLEGLYIKVPETLKQMKELV